MARPLDFSELSRRLRSLAEGARSVARVAPNLADKYRLFRKADELEAQAGRLDAPTPLSQVKAPSKER
jgi:hypothetical protein